jgi:hypothetical protein
MVFTNEFHAEMVASEFSGSGPSAHVLLYFVVEVPDAALAPLCAGTMH